MQTGNRHPPAPRNESAQSGFCAKAALKCASPFVQSSSVSLWQKYRPFRQSCGVGRRRIRVHQLDAADPRARHLNLFHGRDETISEPRARLDEARVARSVAQRASQRIDCGIKAAVETYVHAGPKILREIVAQ